MAEMKISNTLVNDTSSGEIAYSEQLKDRLIDWANSQLEYNKQYQDPEYPDDPTKKIYAVPRSNDLSEQEREKFQTHLNELFLNHYAQFQLFLNDVDLADSTINTWKELEEFLEGISDTDAQKLLDKFDTLQTEIDDINGGDGGTFNLSAYRNQGGVYKVYSSLTEAIADVPDVKQTGGLNMKFIINTGTQESPVYKYVEYRYVPATSAGFDNTDNWQELIFAEPDDQQALVPAFDAASQSVHITEQVLSEQQQRQARSNIDAASQGELATFMHDYRPIEIEGDVTNAPDEEDLTSVNVEGTDVLKLKDKAYAPTIFSGMGRKILRKNIVDSVNTLTQSMISDANTVYVIQYDFTLGEDITVPENCVLEFEGGSIKNTTNNTYKITGTNTTINVDVTYNILNDTLGGGFTLPYVDIRWFGAISDYDEVNKIGTDSSLAFQIAINTLGKFYNGLYIKVVGQYYIGSGIETIYDINIRGNHFNSRNLLGSSDVSETTSQSLIAVGSNIVAFKMLGRGRNTLSTKYCNFNIKNIKIVGDIESSKFILFTANGAPARYSIVEEVEICRMNVFLEVTADDANTMLGGLTMSKCYCYDSGKFIYAHSTKVSSQNAPRILCNLLIENSTIEHNRANTIDVWNSFGNVTIRNNILEGQPSPIRVYATKVEITNNYFEANTGDYTLYLQGTSTVSNNELIVKGNMIDNIAPIFVKRFNIYDNGILQMIKANSKFSECNFYCEIPNNFNINVIDDWCKFSTLLSPKDNLLTNEIYNGKNEGGYIGRKIGTSGWTKIFSHLFEDTNDVLIAFQADKSFFAQISVNATTSYISVSGSPNMVTIARFTPPNIGIYNFFAGLVNTTICGAKIVNKITDISIPSENNIVKSAIEPTFDLKVGFRYYSSNLNKELIASPIYESFETYTIGGSSAASKKKIVSNNFIEGKHYKVSVSNHGNAYLRFGFCTSEIAETPELYIVKEQIGTTPFEFDGVDSSIYPYIYIQCNESFTVTLTTQVQNIKFADLDGHYPVSTSGTFSNKPSSSDIYVGFRYFCTDRQTTEGATDGIEIIYKGNDVWVDALGRVVS